MLILLLATGLLDGWAGVAVSAAPIRPTVTIAPSIIATPTIGASINPTVTITHTEG